MLSVHWQVGIMADEAVKGQEAADTCDDAFLKKIESSMLSQVKLQGIQGIKKVTIRNVSRLVVRPEDGQGYFQENEWMLDTEGVNLQEVSSIPRSFAGLQGLTHNRLSITSNFVHVLHAVDIIWHCAHLTRHKQACTA